MTRRVKIVDIDGDPPACNISRSQRQNSVQRLIETNRRLTQENKVLQKKIEDQTQVLLGSEKMSALGMLAAGVAHEINNPMTYLGGNLEALKTYCARITQLMKIYNRLETKIVQAGSPEVLPYIKSIQAFKERYNMDFMVTDLISLADDCLAGTSHISKIVSDLRHFLRKEDVCEQVDINNIIDISLNIIWHEIKYKAEIKRDFGVLPAVWCCPGKLGQVFMNLLLNAVQAIKENGLIVVSTRHRPSPEDSGSGYVDISIEDNGEGIAEENIGKIFEPFFTTKPAGIGTGLGLAVCRDIIEKHDGQIQVFSRQGKGTKFVISLPVKMAQVPESK